MKTSSLSSRWLILLFAVILVGGIGCTKRAKASRSLQRANSYYAAGQYDRAEIEYLNVLRIQPTNLVAIRNLGDIYYVNESFGRAGSFLAAAKNRNPNDLEARGKLARLYLVSGASKEARAEVDAILPLSPTNENAVLVLAELANKPEELKTNRQRIATLQQKAGDRAIFHVANGLIARKERDLASAEAEFKKAVAMEPQSSLPNLFLGVFYAEMGSNTLAEPNLKAASDLSPIRSPNRVRYATFKAGTGGPDSAKPLADEITSKAPDYVPGWLLSARIALSQTNYTQCLADLKRALDRDPSNFDAMIMRSDVEIAQGELDTAAKTLERLADVYPKNAIPHYQLAQLRLRANDPSRASIALNQALALNPQLLPAILLQAELNIRKGETAGAIDSLTRLTRTHPELERPFVLLGAAYLAAGRYTEAIAILNEAHQRFPRNLDAPHLIGSALKQQGRVAESRALFEKILEQNPNDRVAILELVSLDMLDQKFDAAAKRLQAWMDRAPKNSEPVFEMAKLRYYLKDFNGAKSLFENVIAMNPDAVGAYVLLGRAYLELKQSDAALEKSTTALKKNPTDLGALLLTAVIYENKKDFNNARDTYEKLLTVNSNSIVALNNLASIYCERLHQVEKAYPLARRALELGANNPVFSASVNDTFGWVLSLRGDHQAALPLIKEASRQQPTEPEILAHLGLTQYMAGDEVGARASLENALKLSPSFSRRSDVEDCLAILNINPAAASQDAIARLEKRLAESPADAPAIARLGSIYEQAGNIDKAVALYEKAIAANPKLAFGFARLAELNERKQNSAKALELAKNARKLDSSSPQIAHLAGRLASKSTDLNDQQWGLTLLQETSQKNQNDPEIASDLAWAFYTQGRLAEAESAMKKAAAAPNSPIGADANRFLQFLPLLDPARAAQQQPAIDQALKENPNYLPALAALAAAQQKTGPSMALKTCDNILSRYPGFTPAIRNFVVLSAAQSTDAAKALSIASRARETLRDDSEFAKAVGLLQYQRADYQAAVRTLADVSKKRPDDETVHYFLGMSYYKLKQPKETKVALKKAIDLQPKAAFASEVQRILTELK